MTTVHILGSSIFIFVFLLIIPITYSISESEALLKLKVSLTNATALDSWKLGSAPCTGDENKWYGVKCGNGSVTGLRLGYSGLSGKIDIDALASIPSLRSISFMSNSFSGPIPDFSPLGNLRGLFLSKNQFSGEIPLDYFAKMEGLRKVWLSENGFTGLIPSSLARLPHLIELNLDNNRFSGLIPPLKQANLFFLNLSNNNLEGEIPAGLSRFGSNAFMGNPGLCGGNLDKACDKPPLEIDSRQMKIILWVLFASLIILFASMIYGIYVLKRRQDENPEIADNFEPSISASSDGKRILETGRGGFGSGHRTGSGHKGSSKYKKGIGDIVMMNDDKGEFGMTDLMKAAAEVLGNGHLGSSYRATMASGLTVVVKRVKQMTKIGKDQFDSEVRRLGSLKHKNVLAPLAYHYRKDEKLLVYEYQPKGSLLLVLHGDTGISHAQLTWPVRFKIIHGVAKGLAHLHAQLSSLSLPHGNLKSSNILLSQDYEPLLTDYGLNHLINSDHALQALAAYKSPEAILRRDNVSRKSDMYCLGIVILEILTGKLPSQYNNCEAGTTDIVRWVKSAIVEGREGDVFDPDITIGRDKDSCASEMEQLLRVGAGCTESDPEKRMDIMEVVGRIEGLRKEEDDPDAKTVRFQTASGNLYDDQSEEVSSSFREKA